MTTESETYNQRVLYQEELDALFPRGALFATVVIDSRNRQSPTGIGFVTGRVFCSDARVTDRGWEYKLFFEPRWLTEDAYEFFPTYEAWTAAIDGTDEVETYEVAVIEDEEVPLVEVIRLRTDHRLHSGQREFVTALRLQELFPFGLEQRKETVNAASDSD